VAATLSIAGCAAAASAATSSFSTPFAASFLAGRVILLLLHARAWRHIPEAQPTIGVYLVTIAASSVLWTVRRGPIPIVLVAAALEHTSALLHVAVLALICLALAVRGTVSRRDGK
jgi:hypothetical protein